jgi:hypothetical protein
MRRRTIAITAAAVLAVGAFSAAGADEEPTALPAPTPTLSAAPATTPEPTTPAPEPTTEEPAPDCLDVPAELVDSIARGARDPQDFIPGEAAAFRSEDHSKVFLVALKFQESDGFEQVGVWATNDLGTSGITMAVDDVAKEATDWLDASTTDARITNMTRGYFDAKDCLA